MGSIGSQNGLEGSYYGTSYQPEGITHADQKRPEDQFIQQQMQQQPMLQ